MVAKAWLLPFDMNWKTQYIARRFESTYGLRFQKSSWQLAGKGRFLCAVAAGTSPRSEALSEEKSHCQIREAKGSDAAAITTLYRSFVSSPHIKVLEERLERIASDANNFLFVCEVDAEVCGTAFLTLCLDPMFGNQPYGVLENVVIDESWRGKGIGRKLFEHVEELCAIRDCSKIMLLSSASRRLAHVFFEQQGFTSEDKRGFVKYRSQFRVR